MTKEEYFSIVENWSLKKNSRIVIYGAGKFGKKLCRLLEESGIIPDAFIVTDMKNNKEEVTGKKVYAVDEYVKRIERGEQVLALVAVKPPWNRKIIDLIQERYSDIAYLDLIPELMNLNVKTELFEINAVVGCSIACKYCPQKKLINAYTGKKMLSLEDFKTAIDKIPPYMTIAFSGFSEPFLNPEMAEMIRYAGEKGRDIFLNSTLVGLTKEKFEIIKDVPISGFVLHLPDKNQNAKIPISDDYIQVLKQVLDWKQIKDGEEQSVVTKANGQGEPPDEISGIVSGKVLFHIELADRAGNLNDQELYSIGSHKGPIYCSYSPALNNNVMMPNGDIYLCCMDFGLQHKLGNILSQNWDEIRNSKELKRIRAALQDETKECLCRHCTEALTCNNVED